MALPAVRGGGALPFSRPLQGGDLGLPLGRTARGKGAVIRALELCCP